MQRMFQILQLIKDLQRFLRLLGLSTIYQKCCCRTRVFLVVLICLCRSLLALQQQRPLFVIKAIFSLSSLAIQIWLQPKKSSMKDITLNPEVASISWSILESRQLSFGQALFRSMQSMQIHHFLLAFLIKTTFVSQL